MPRLSIVIPSIGSAAQLERTLLSVLENKPEQCEVLVVLSAPYDDPYALEEDEVRFVRGRLGGTFSDCLNLGLRASRSDLVHWLAGGAEAQPGWTVEPCRLLAGRAAAAVAPVVLRAEGSHIASAGLAYQVSGEPRALLSGEPVARVPGAPTHILGPSLVAGFIRKEAFFAAGGWQAGCGETLADVDLALRLRNAGYDALLAPSSRVQDRGAAVPCSSEFAAGRALERLYWRHAQRDARRNLAAHLLLLAREAATALIRPRNVLRLAGRLAGLLPASAPRAAAPAGHPVMRGPHARPGAPVERWSQDVSREE